MVTELRQDNKERWFMKEKLDPELDPQFAAIVSALRAGDDNQAARLQRYRREEYRFDQGMVWFLIFCVLTLSGLCISIYRNEQRHEHDRLRPNPTHRSQSSQLGSD
jgi:hypothetical protein